MNALPTWWPREVPAPNMLAIPRYVSSRDLMESRRIAQAAKQLACPMTTARMKGEA